MSGLIALVLRLLLALALYGFLAWALYTLWAEIRREAGRARGLGVFTMFAVLATGVLHYMRHGPLEAPEDENQEKEES